MSSFVQKHYRGFYFLLPVLLGLSFGYLAATALGIWLSPPALPAATLTREQPAPARAPTLPDYQIVLDRNIFDSASRGQLALHAEETTIGAPSLPVARVNLSLFGTVTRGEASLAIIKSDQGVKIYHLNDEVPGGGKLEEIARHSVQIRYGDGSTQILPLFEAPGEQRGTAATRGAAAPAGAKPGGQVQAVGENRFVIPQEVAEQARGNINALLKQARVEPNIVNGKTEGFVVRMIQPRSLLANLGIQRGDVLMQVNGVELNSPEKALQIFQQLREAKNISIGLTRGGNNLNFQYEVN